MAKRVLTAAMWGLAGLIVALILTLGAFALAGKDIGDPATFTGFPSVQDASRSPTPEIGRSRTLDPSPTAHEDRGEDSSGQGSTSSGSGSDGVGSDDQSGSGSPSSGPGSSGTGSGSEGDVHEDNSGSDSPGSGSGSDDRGGDDGESHQHDDD